jgi:hypothetical protein
MSRYDRKGREASQKYVGRLLDAQVKEPSKYLNLRTLGESERILNINAQISNGAFKFGVAEQNLHSPQVAGLFVNNRCLGPTQRVGAIVLP